VLSLLTLPVLMHSRQIGSSAKTCSRIFIHRRPRIRLGDAPCQVTAG
jgi:hypothetical protein